MTHLDWQQIVTIGIVAIAAASVGRRLISQLNGFRNSKTSSSSNGSVGCGSCNGCETNSSAKAVPLVQIQLTAPKRIQRSSGEQ